MTEQSKEPPPVVVAAARPGIGEAGQTGHWRTERPVVDAQRCLAARTGEACCQICWLFCPEAVIAQGSPPQIDFTYCKGCGICAVECPRGAITMRPEHEQEELP